MSVKSEKKGEISKIGDVDASVLLVVTQIPRREPGAGNDPQSCYFLHRSDTTNLVLVFELLTDDNYVTWSRSMMIALAIRNKVGFVDESIPRPTEEESLALWTRNNYTVIAWILNSVSKKISSSIIFIDSARAIWLDLKERFQKRNGPRIFHLRKGHISLKQDDESVTGYFSKMKGLWDEYTTYRPSCTCGLCRCEGVRAMENFVQFEYLLNFLMGLKEEFVHTRSQILLMDPTPTVSKAFSLIVQKVEQRLDSVSKIAPAMVLAADNGGNHVNSFKNQEANNFSRGKGTKPVCSNCGCQCHTVDKCYRIHGFPLGFRSKRINNTQKANVATTSGTSAQHSTERHSESDIKLASVQGKSI